MFISANPKPTTTYRNSVKMAAAYRIKYETCKAKYAAKGKPVFPPTGKCKSYYQKYEKYRLRASDAAKKALAKGGLTPELQAELSKAAKGVLDLAQTTGFIPATDAEIQAAGESVAEEPVAETETEVAPADNTMLYAGAALAGIVVLGTAAYFVFRR